MWVSVHKLLLFTWILHLNQEYTDASTGINRFIQTRDINIFYKISVGKLYNNFIWLKDTFVLDATGYAVGIPDDPKCSVGYIRITTIDDCKLAAKSLGSYSREGNWNDIPFGCYRTNGSHSIYFNYNNDKDYLISNNMGSHQGLATICKAYGTFFIDHIIW